MVSSGLVLLIILQAFLIIKCQNQSESTTLSLSTLYQIESLTETTTAPTKNATLENNESSMNDGYIDMEIISIQVLAQPGNSVELSWGEPIREYNLDWTYGVYYGLTQQEALKEPKLRTKKLYAQVSNLTFCRQYTFAVGVLDANTTKRIAHPPRNIRTIATLIDQRSSPDNLQVDFIPDEHPCLLIKWSASCPNILIPLGYSVTVLEKAPARLTIITEPRTTAVDLRQTLRVIYGKSYDIKVATDVAGSNATAIVSYKVPLFLQPFRVRLTSQPDGAFMMYWREPYVPYYVGPYYYQVYVYPGKGLSNKYDTFSVTKPIFLFKGNESEYTFMVGLKSIDGEFESYLTDPLAKSLNGETITLTIS